MVVARERVMQAAVDGRQWKRTGGKTVAENK